MNSARIYTEARTCEDDWALNSCKGEEKKKMKRSSYLFSFSRAANEIKNAPRQFTRYLTQWQKGFSFRWNERRLFSFEIRFLFLMMGALQAMQIMTTLREVCYVFLTL